MRGLPPELTLYQVVRYCSMGPNSGFLREELGGGGDMEWLRGTCAQLHPTFCAPTDCSQAFRFPFCLFLSGIFQMGIGVGCHFLTQRIFLDPGLN